ncbi:MAG: VWA domain-containing protein [Candidatus Kapabacteria bacterium]|nr:VWA domain-containing protein [Candidatus Kapabacteria bacterium]
MKFANPEYFFALIIIPALILWYVLRNKKQNPAISLSSFSGFMGIAPSLKVQFRHSIFVLRLVGIVLLIVAIARPQSSSSRKSVSTEGIDIVMTIDVSTSMLAEDFKPNRIEAAKKTAMKFIENRENDRIGLVIFSGESFTQCPITIDHAVIKNLFFNIKSGMIEDGTAIGNGLSTAVARVKDSKAKSKVIILLTDGVNNMGSVSPITAAEIAKTFGIRVYTIGVGAHGKAPYPVKMRDFTGNIITQYQNIDVDLDENLLKQIASLTGGKYYRATGNKALEEIYSEIDKLEKTRIDVAYFSRYSELFFPYALVAFILLAVELLFRYTIFKTLP